jgi:hypothetical protein
MVLAGIIATIAIVTNNPVLIVGAMIVSPDYGSMAALSVALVNGCSGAPGSRSADRAEPRRVRGRVRRRS